MYDTVNMWIDRDDTAGGNPFAVLPFLSDITEKQSERFGYSCYGQLGDYTVICYQAGISLKGSLAKFYLPSNFYTLTRQQTDEAVEKLSDQLHLDLGKAKVNRIDVSTVIPTKRPPSDYYSRLGNKPHFERVQTTKNTLYYQTQRRQLVFYDKLRETAAKGVERPSSLDELDHFLRYELRFMGKLPSQLKCSTITAKTLSDEDFYYSIVQRWKQEFETIKKIHQSNNMVNLKNIKTPKDAMSVLLAKLLQQNGQNTINDFLADLKASNVFSDRKYYSRLKSDLTGLIQATGGNEDDLTKELETAVNNFARYAR